MAELMIISETGMFHSACRFTFLSGPVCTVQWRGFQPAKSRTPISPGKVEKVDRTKYINHYITFEVHETVLRKAMDSVSRKYASKGYKLGVVDCVSFSADVARQCRLRVPLVNITPYGLIEVLSWWNDYAEFK